MGFLSNLFGGGRNPADAAMPYLNQVAPMAQQNYNPYIQQGQQAMNQNAGQYAQMVGNPAAFYNQLQATYSPSAGYQFKQDKYQKAAEGAAAAGGYRGTQADQAAQAQLVQGLLGEDEGAYLDRVLGILGAGLQGNEQAATRGFGATSDLTNILGSTLGTQAGLAFKGQENKNATNAGFAKMLMQLLGGAGGALLTGGSPMGAAIGANVMGGNVPYPQSGQPSNQKQMGTGLTSPMFGGNYAG